MPNSSHSGLSTQLTLDVQSHDPARDHLSRAIFESAAKLFLDAGVDYTQTLAELALSIEKPPESALGDFAFPCFRFSKSLRKAPAVVAEALADQLRASKNPWIERIEVKSAFLNIFVNPKQMAEFTLPNVLNGNFFNILSDSPTNQMAKTMVEFSQPNTHKEFHVGHGRNVCLGDSLVQIYRYNGFPVVPVNYIGDEGAHVAKCIWQMKAYLREHPSSLAAATNKAEWYNQRYIEATIKLDGADEEKKKIFLSEISEILKSIESQKGEDFELWKSSRADCLQSFEEIYKWLGVKFDHVFYESEVSGECQAIVDEGIRSGLFTESDGAYGVDLKDFKLGYFLARKRDGNSLYITKDLALARRKFRDFKIERSIYVVADEQTFHFKQLFKVLEMMGFEQAKQCYHLAYGMVVLPEGKMSSRKGNSFTFRQLKDFVESEIGRHLQKYVGDWTPEQIKETGEILTLGAIKYGMLSMDPNREIVFEPKLWVNFEGDSGPYLMYAYARTRSILAKGALEGYSPNLKNLDRVDSEAEKVLIRSIYDFNGAVVAASRNHRPSTLANHLYEMCKDFNRFYAETPVLKASDKDLIESRLGLVAAFGETLSRGLKLLGIKTVEKM